MGGAVRVGGASVQVPKRKFGFTSQQEDSVSDQMENWIWMKTVVMVMKPVFTSVSVKTERRRPYGTTGSSPPLLLHADFIYLDF